MNLPIVVVAYNRPASLMRLLGSLNNAVYPQKVKLIISIDKSDDKSVENIASEFNWKHGEKELIIHEEHLGLRDHILSVGDLSKHADGIIVLEDDLFVSPFFYDYTLQAFTYYNSDSNIAGISLYSHNYNESARLPFIPLLDGSDVFFTQIPSSWGQCWSMKQWAEFRKWMNENENKEADPSSGLPANALDWPPSSWKKYYFWYMISLNKYFVYPRHSLTSNFCDPGTHYKGKDLYLHTPMLAGEKVFIFKTLLESFAVYDAFCEIIPGRLSVLQPLLENYNFTCDLYGIKTIDYISTPYVLTSRKCSNYVLSFARELKPHEANIISHVAGKELFLAKTNSCASNTVGSIIPDENLFYFFKLRKFQIEPYIKLNEKINSLNEIQQKLNASLTHKEQLLTLKDESILAIKEALSQRDETIKQKDILLNQRNEIIKQKDDLITQGNNIIKHKDELLIQRNDTINLKDDLLNQRNDIIKQKDELLNQRNETIKQNENLIAQVSDLLAQKSETIRQKEDLLILKDNSLQQHQELITVQQTELHTKGLVIKQLNEQNDKNGQQVKEQNNIIAQLKAEMDSSGKLLEQTLAYLAESRKQLQQKDEMLMANSNALREKSKLLTEKQEQLKQRDELLKRVEQSYTFKIGKVIVWPFKKITGR